MHRQTALKVLVAVLALMLVSVTSSLVVPQAQNYNRGYIVGGEVIATPISAAVESVKWILVAGTVSAAVAFLVRKRK